MKRFKRHRDHSRSQEEKTSVAPRIWWNNKDQRLLWLHDAQKYEIKSPEHLQILAENVAYVLVSSRHDQYPARLAAIEVLHPQRVKIALADRWSSFGHSDRQESDREKGRSSEIEKVLPRPVVDEYDLPLTYLQGAVFNGNTFGDPLEAFAKTWMGEFHQFWGLSINHAAARLWACVGDVLEWLAPPEVISPDLSDAVEICENRCPKQDEKKPHLELGKVFLLLFSAGKRRGTFPSEKWPLGEIAARIVHRHSIRNLLPLAWAGEVDIEMALTAKVSDPDRPLSDPRAWLWRGLLRSSVEKVNHAYVECVIAWVLARLIHPELFPPVQPLLDPPAQDYWRNHRQPLGKEKVC